MPFLLGEAETAETLQPRDKAQGAIINTYRYLMGGKEEEEARTFQ